MPVESSSSASKFENISVAPGASIPQEALPVLAHFDQILKIPRPSGQEEQIRQHLIRVAESKGLEYKTDEVGNLAIYVPATPGFEDRPGIVFQGHMDMVPYGGNETTGTKAVVHADGWMRSDGKTTLGADNGIALATMFALLEDENLQHGPLTFLITVDEEEGLNGANGLDTELIPQNTGYLVNLDAEQGPKFVCVGCAGGVNTVATFNIAKKREVPLDYQEMEITISEMPGGHSGDEIHEERGNPIISLGRALLKVREVVPDFRLIEISGGHRHNAIPKESTARVAIPPERITEVREALVEFTNELTHDPQNADLHPDHINGLSVKVSLELVTHGNVLAISAEVRDEVLAVLTCIPNGVAEALGGFKGGVLTSSSIGTLDHPKKEGSDELDTDKLELAVLIRAAQEKDLLARAASLEASFPQNVDVRRSGQYPGWLELEGSKAVALALRATRDVLGEAIAYPIHAGLEAGFITDRLAKAGTHERIPAVAIGPRIKSPHGNDERIEVSTIVESLEVIKKMAELVALGEDKQAA